MLPLPLLPAWLAAPLPLLRTKGEEMLDRKHPLSIAAELLGDCESVRGQRSVVPVDYLVSLQEFGS